MILRVKYRTVRGFVLRIVYYILYDIRIIILYLYIHYILTHKCEIDIIASVSFEEYELSREATVLSSSTP